jgi:hypothetical protein
METILFRKVIKKNPTKGIKKVHSFVSAFGLLEKNEMKGFDYKKALNRTSLWQR